jgi:UDP-N-acetylglucosamine 2-epimerase (hydrolysing)
MAKTKKRITFLTGTRADFGKLLPLIREIKTSRQYQVEVVATGMHLLADYGYTINEIQKSGIRQIFPIFNQDSSSSEKMDIVLANTITQLSHYLNERQPDMIVVHGDRVEALAGAIAGALNNIPVTHIEGGEVSGTIDESIRHAITKMAHIHLVSNDEACRRLVQMGESKESIFIIGSPEVDIMLSGDLPNLDAAKKRYGVKFDEYAIFVYHPVSTELDALTDNINSVIQALDATDHNFIAIQPNNDIGSELVRPVIRRFGEGNRVKLFPSLRFEYYLRFLKDARYIIGNSSSAVREAPVFGVPCVNIGSRQNNRVNGNGIFNVDEDTDKILSTIGSLPNRVKSMQRFGKGDAASTFIKLLEDDTLWSISLQKRFVDMSSANFGELPKKRRKSTKRKSSANS